MKQNSSSFAVAMSAFRQQKALRLPLYLILLFLSLLLISDIRANPNLVRSFLGVGAALFIWQLVLLIRSVRQERGLKIRVVLSKPHYVQAVLQVLLFAYWGWHWNEVYAHLALIISQLVFAYAFDMLLCWSRRDEWVLGFGQFPIVLSTNLFLWFRDDWFFLQFLMVAAAYMGKEFLRWRRDGRTVHIFNPSALSLALFSTVLIVTGYTDITWGKQIAITFAYPEYIYVQIFFLGLVVMYLFSVTLVTLSAVVALYVINVIYTGNTGIYFFLDSNIPAAVFLGLHLLVTDPATSPRTDLGRVIFGGLYGAGVAVLYGLFEHIGVPTFYDKLLCVPFLNLTVPLLDRFAASPRLKRLRLSSLGLSLTPERRNLVHIGVWLGLFIGMIATNFVGAKHEGRTTAFWRRACEQGLHNGCGNLLIVQSALCANGSAPACNAVGILLTEGKATARAPGEAAAAFARACDLGSPAGCIKAGNLAAAVALFGEFCAKGEAASCYRLGSAHAIGAGVAVDKSRAFQLYRKACELGWPSGCGGMAQSYLRGEGVALSLERAAAGFGTACAGGDAGSCSNLGLMYYRGEGVARDQTRAVELLRKACQMGMSKACGWQQGLER